MSVDEPLPLLHTATSQDLHSTSDLNTPDLLSSHSAKSHDLSSTHELNLSNNALSPHEQTDQSLAQMVRIEQEYKSGALYRGHVINNHKAGSGTFIWANGAKYCGEFVDNRRHGQGRQEWPDGSTYTGQLEADMRHGDGEQTWPNGEVYRGKFFRDRRHGRGTYSWKDGSVYEGTFYLDKKEGYGTFTDTDGSVFEGLYVNDERSGPGVTTYTDGRQDIGLWHRERLVKLCTPIEGAFTIKDHNEVEYFPEEHLKPLKKPTIIKNRNDIVNNILNPPDLFNYNPSTNASRIEQIFDDGLHCRSLAMDIEAFDKEFFKDAMESFDDDEEVMYCWNNTPSCVAMQRSIVRHSGAQTNVNFNVDNVVKGERLCGGVKREKKGKTKDKSGRKDKRKKRGVTEGEKVDEEQKEDEQSRQEDEGEELGDQDGSGEENEEKKSNAEVEVFSDEEKVDREKIPESDTEHLEQDPDTTQGQRARETDTPEQMAQTADTPQGKSKKVSGTPQKKRAKAPDIVPGKGPSGPVEVDSEVFITAATQGDINTVQTLLHNGAVHVDVADKNGHTALLAASVNWNQDIINCLLDNGADVNRLNDEGLSALGACMIHYYSVDGFKPNIAEKNLVLPETNATEDPYEANIVKTNLKKTPPKSRESQRSTVTSVDSKRIERLRKEYSGEHIVISEEQESPRQPVIPRKLGTLHVKRTVKINIDDILGVDTKDTQRDDGSRLSDYYSDDCSVVSDFESVKSVRNYGIVVNEQQIDRCATVLSTNVGVVSAGTSSGLNTAGTVRRLAIDKARREVMKQTIELLLRRGADPNACQIPMAAIFYAVKAADVWMVRLLLSKGASTSVRLSDKLGGLAPLHIAAAVPCDEGVIITQLLLDALADPDVRATPDDSFLDTMLEEEWSKDPIDPISQQLLGGRTPLQLACARDDNYTNSASVVRLLLSHHARHDLLCNGHSPLSLCIASGNDLALEDLLLSSADPSQHLTHGVGSPLCAAANNRHEHRRPPTARLQLIDRLVKAGADPLAGVAVGPKRQIGTAVDYAYHLYNQDRPIAHMPYHALTQAQKATFNARKRLQQHQADVLRNAYIEWKKRKTEDSKIRPVVSRLGSSFIYTGTGVKVSRESKRTLPKITDSRVSFSAGHDGEVSEPAHYRFCYECGRSVGVRLAPCTRCRTIYYCSKACKLKAWNTRHKDECVRIEGKSGKGRFGSKMAKSAAANAKDGKQKLTDGRKIGGKDALGLGPNQLPKLGSHHLGSHSLGSHHLGSHSLGSNHLNYKNSQSNSGSQEIEYTENYSWV